MAAWPSSESEGVESVHHCTRNLASPNVGPLSHRSLTFERRHTFITTLGPSPDLLRFVSPLSGSGAPLSQQWTSVPPFLSTGSPFSHCWTLFLASPQLWTRLLAFSMWWTRIPPLPHTWAPACPYHSSGPISWYPDVSPLSGAGALFSDVGSDVKRLLRFGRCRTPYQPLFPLCGLHLTTCLRSILTWYPTRSLAFIWPYRWSIVEYGNAMAHKHTHCLTRTVNGRPFPRKAISETRPASCSHRVNGRPGEQSLNDSD